MDMEEAGEYTPEEDPLIHTNLSSLADEFYAIHEIAGEEDLVDDSDYFEFRNAEEDVRELPKRVPTPQYFVDDSAVLTKFLTEDHTVEDQINDFANNLVAPRKVGSLEERVQPKLDDFGYEEIDIARLYKKAVSYLVLGKPGVGCSTFAAVFAKDYNLIHVETKPILKVNEVTEEEDLPQIPEEEREVDLKATFDAICQRLTSKEVEERGYVLTGWPLYLPDTLSLKDQIEMLNLLPILPDFIFLIQMEDSDLIKRRMTQKVDPETGIVYTRSQYMKVARNSDVGVAEFPKRDSVMEITDEYLPNAPEESIGRLISRGQDSPLIVRRQLQRFSEALPCFQKYTSQFNSSNVFEIDAYWTPLKHLQRVTRFLSAIGVMPAPVPRLLFEPTPMVEKAVRGEGVEGAFLQEEGMDEEEPDDGLECIPEPQEKVDEEIVYDWDSVFKAAVSKSKVDPRFRWEISKWKNLCPVALKEGRSKIGNPQLAYGFHDKVYFLSSEESVKKFIDTTRFYLRPCMPTSPVKFFVIGHPLAGKTEFAQQLACVTRGMVINMEEKVKIWLEPVKQRFLFKVRFDSTLKAKRAIEKTLYREWKRQEKMRRFNIKQWIEEYTKRKAAEVLSEALALERAQRMQKYRKLRYESEKHALTLDKAGGPFGSDQLSFSWKKFVDSIRAGVDGWSHQAKLELAWELLRQGKLRYKTLQRLPRPRRPFDSFAGEGGEGEPDDYGMGEDEGEGGPYEGPEFVGEFGGEEQPNVPVRRRKKRRKKPFCKEQIDEESDELSSEDESDMESDELLALRYPDMCPELVQPIPRPLQVSEDNDIVQSYVAQELSNMEKWFATMPCEIYEEILQIAIDEAEAVFREKYPDAHLSGGWIVDDFCMDADKWRCVLRNPKLCPDQIFVLQDQSEEHKALLHRLSKKSSVVGADELLGEMEPEGGGAVGINSSAMLGNNSVRNSVSAINVAKMSFDLTEEDDSGYRDLLIRDANRNQSPVYSEADYGETTCSWYSREHLAFPREPLPYYVDDTQSPRHEIHCAEMLTVPHEMVAIEPLNKLESGYSTSRVNIRDSALMPGSKPSSKLFPMPSEVIDADVAEFLSSSKSAVNEVISQVQSLQLEFGTVPKTRAGLRLQRRISEFENSWNMIFPVVQEQKITHWDVGLIDSSNAYEKAVEYWQILESRFELWPVRISKEELEEYDDDVLDAVYRWTGRSGLFNEREGEDASDEEGRYGKEFPGEHEDDEGGSPHIPRLIRRLEQKPDEFCSAMEEIEKNRPFGNFSYYCPVSLVDKHEVRKGNSRFAAKYQNRIYYFVNKEFLSRFIANPKKYLKPPPYCIPPPRICVTGSPGCNQFEMVSQLAKQLNVYCVNFRDWLLGIVSCRLGRPVGPLKSAEIVTRDDSYDFRKVLSSTTMEHGGEGDNIVVPEDSASDVDWIMDHYQRNYVGVQDDDVPRIFSYDVDRIENSELRAATARLKDGLTKAEKHIKAFLETGAQLPDEILDKYVTQFWKEEPYKSKGFFLVGFPNSVEDVKFLQSRGLYPEKIYVVQCSKKACRNRLIASVMASMKKIEYKGRTRIGERPYMCDELDKVLHTDHRPYQDSNLVKAGKVIYYYHHICTKDHFAMKAYLNTIPMCWTPLFADYSLLETERELSSQITPRILHRQNIFEVMHRLYDEEAEELLRSGYFQLSRFKRWCPVEVYKGNWAVNLWNAPAVRKFPILHRKFIYFIASDKNYSRFCNQVLKMITQPRSPPVSNQTILYILGHPKAGKTELAYRIANNLGLEYVREESILYTVLQHNSLLPPGQEKLYSPYSLPMKFAQRLLAYIQEGFSVPSYMMCQALNYTLMRPQVQYHGAVFDGFPLLDVYTKNLYGRGIVPDLTVNIKMDLETVLQRVDALREGDPGETEDLIPSDELVISEFHALGNEGASCVFGTAHAAGKLLTVNGSINPAAIATLVAGKVIEMQTGVSQLKDDYCKFNAWDSEYEVSRDKEQRCSVQIQDDQLNSEN